MLQGTRSSPTEPPAPRPLPPPPLAPPPSPQLDNLMLKGKDANSSVVKISDFGLHALVQRRRTGLHAGTWHGRQSTGKGDVGDASSTQQPPPQQQQQPGQRVLEKM